ncbi:MAG: S-methyl-5'-thioadenosine phosphorylase [Acidimicrobiia bacterium]
MIGVFGGSGFYEFLSGAREVDVPTPYGPPAAPVTVGTLDEVEVTFLPRHGRRHQFPAHRIPYRANTWAMHELGVDRIIGPCAVGSLKKELAIGHLVICDQLVDRTWGRDSTFYDGPGTAHIAFADPYCPELRPLAVQAGRDAGATVHDGGTVIVVQGPRFSTRAESRAYTAEGWQVINMTQAPEAALARELEICYVNISVITDYDVGVEGEVAPVTHAEVLRHFDESLDTVKDMVRRLIPQAAATKRSCPCATAKSDAVG